MQDNARGHSARATRKKLEERDIALIFWPAFSPDLNPIEKLWNWMKDWIQDVYGSIDKVSMDELRFIVQQAWDAVTKDILEELIDSMHDRCQAVIDAGGKYTKF